MRDIGCDIDGTIADLAPTMLAVARKLFPQKMKNFQLSDWVTYGLRDCTFLTWQEEMEIYEYINELDLVSSLPFVPGARDKIFEWVTQDRVWFITARGGFWPKWKRLTIDWFHWNGIPATRDQFIFDCKNEGKWKVDHIQDLELKYFIEDCGEEAIKIAEGGVKVFLIDYPWNRFVEHPLIQRVKSWEEIKI